MAVLGPKLESGCAAQLQQYFTVLLPGLLETGVPRCKGDVQNINRGIKAHPNSTKYFDIDVLDEHWEHSGPGGRLWPEGGATIR